MPETHGEPFRDGHGSRASNAQTGVARPAWHGPPLSPNTRRHLGIVLRAVYDAAPAKPPGERIEALLDRLGKIYPDTATTETTGG